MADFPTLGLNFDLDQVVAGTAQLDKTQEAFDRVGDSAERAGNKAQAAAAKIAGAGAAAPRATGVGRAAQSAAAEADGATKQVAEAIAKVEAAVNAGGVTLTTSVDRQAQRVRAAVQNLFAPEALRGAERGRMQAQLEQTFAGLQQAVERGGVSLITSAGNQAQQIRAAVSGLVAPDALGGAERARFQAQLEQTFGAIEQDIVGQVENLGRFNEQQRGKVAASLAALLNPDTGLSSAGRGARQAELDATFGGQTAAMAAAAEEQARATAQATAVAAANADAVVREAEANVKAALAAGENSAAVRLQSEAYVELAAALRAASSARAEQAGATAAGKGLDVGQAVATSLAQTEAAAQVAEKGAREAAGAVSGIGTSAVTVRESLVLLREGARGDFSRMAGSASILAQNIGGVGIILRAIPFLAVAAAIGAVVFEMAKGSDEAARLNNLLAVTNQFAGLTQQSFETLAGSISNSTGTAIGKVNELLTGLVGGGQLSAQAIGLVADASARLAVLTGGDAAKISQELSSAFSDPTAEAKKLEDQYHFLSAAQYEHIANLQAQGDKEGALISLYSAFDDNLKSQAANVGLLEGAWRSLSDGISQAINALRNYGKQASLEQQRKDAQVQANLQAGDIVEGTTGGMGGTLGMAPNRLDAATAAGLRASAQARLKQIDAQIAQQQQQGADARIQTAAIGAQSTLQSGLDAARTNQQRADNAVKAYDDAIAKTRAALARKPDPALQKTLDEAIAARPEVVARYQKQYAGGRPDRSGNRAASQAAAAQRDVEQVANAIKQANTELDQAAQFNLSPLADSAAKIAKAYDDALSKFSNTTNGFKSGQAQAFAASAAEKEQLTILAQLANAQVKAAAADQLRLQALRAEVAANDNAARAIDAYYQAGTGGSAQYAEALQRQAAAVLAGKNTQSELSIAQQFGVTSVDQISAAIQQQLSVEGRLTPELAKRADQIQEEAKRRLALAVAVNTETDAKAANENRAAGHTAALQSIDDLTREAAAYAAGTDAIIAYERQKAISAALVGKIPANATPEQRKAIVGQVTADNDNQALAGYNDQEAKRLKLLHDEQNLLAMSSQEREIEAAAVERATAAAKAGLYPTYQTALAAERIKAAAEASDTAWARTAGVIKDDLRNSFIQTGTLDFAGVEKGFAQAIREAVYDELLAKPIDIVINAAVKIEQQFLQSAIQGILGKVGGLGGEGGIGSLISGFGDSKLGIGQYLQTALPGVLQKFGVSVGDAIKTANIAGKIGGALANAGIGATAGSLAGGIFGVRQNTGASIGGGIGGLLGGLTPLGPLGAVLGGILGNVVGSLLGGKPTNAAAVVSLDSTGNVTDIGGSKRTDETTKSATSAAQAIAQGEQALRQAGLTLGATVTSVDLGVRDTTHILLSNGQRLETAVGDAQAAATAALQAIVANSHTNDATLDALIHKMAAAGDSIQDVANAIQNYNTAQAFVKGLGTAALQYTDPQAYAVAQLKDQQATRRTQLQGYLDQGYISQAQFGTASTQLDTLEGLELKDTLSKFADAVTDATHSLADFQSAQKKVADYVSGLRTGSTSPLSPVDMLNAAGSQFQAQFGKAQGGDYDALSGITDNASTYLQAAQSYYGSSSAYAAIFQQVEQQLDQLSTADIKDPVSQTITNTSAQVVDAINSGTEATVAAINGAGSPSTATAAAGDAAGTSVAQQLGTPVSVDNSDLVAVIQDGFAANSKQLARVGEAVVGSNDQGYQQLDSTIARSGSAALSGGAVPRAVAA